MKNGELSIFSGLTNSFNPSGYGKIVKQKFGRSFLYLSVIVMVISALLAVKIGYTLTKLMDEFISKVGQEIPEIRITNGIVSVPVEQPYLHEIEGYSFIIDTTGEISSLDEYESGLLLTKNKLIYKDKARMRTESYDLSQVASLHITPELLNAWTKKGGKVLFPVLFAALTVYFLIAKFIQILLFSLASLFANNLKKKNLNYPELLNIGIYALTAPTLLAVIMVLFDLKIPLFGLIYSLIYVFILVLAIGKIPQQGEVK